MSSRKDLTTVFPSTVENIIKEILWLLRFFFSDLQAWLIFVFINTEISTFSTIISFVLFLFVQIVLGGGAK